MSTEVNQISGEFFLSQLFGLPNMYFKKHDFLQDRHGRGTDCVVHTKLSVTKVIRQSSVTKGGDMPLVPAFNIFYFLNSEAISFVIHLRT